MTSTTSEADLWIRRLRPFPMSAPEPPDDLALVCFPHAGGSASYFAPLARALSGIAHVWAVQYPGRQDRRTEPCVDQLPALARSIASAVIEHPPGARAPVFLGHSMGAALAFETAIDLERRGHGVARLIVSGRRAPSTLRDDAMHLDPDDVLLERVAALGGAGNTLFADPEMRALVLPAIRADLRAVENHRTGPGTVLRAPISALTGNADPLTTVDEARRWVEHTSGEFECTVFDGGHFFLESRAAEVIRLITGRLRPGSV